MHRPTPSALRRDAARASHRRCAERALYRPASGEARTIDVIGLAPRVALDAGRGRFVDHEFTAIVLTEDAPELAEGDVLELEAGVFAVAERLDAEDPFRITQKLGLRKK